MTHPLFICYILQCTTALDVIQQLSLTSYRLRKYTPKKLLGFLLLGMAPPSGFFSATSFWCSNIVCPYRPFPA
ncbi:hypothetical protein SAMN05216605_11995 [Pseudomonas abietaniphila]|uniref:Uncharacterized protein n=1 Tax=Pseudomonas abietaniphila TaxID=89065 RepID=A0A1G8PSS9_9PSED|nr:hypothetical protein SAMN05216605_11995 [Pseudomonas abietaniphila]